MRPCSLGMRQCIYLRHVAGNGCVQPEASKVEAVRDFPRPTTKKQVRGLSGYYRRFIPRYSSISIPLTDLTKKNLPFKVQWTRQCEEAFIKLKQCLCTAPVLTNLDFEKTFSLQTDASNVGISAILSQKDCEGQDHPIAYYSRKLLPRETRYSTSRIAKRSVWL